MFYPQERVPQLSKFVGFAANQALFGAEAFFAVDLGKFNRMLAYLAEFVIIQSLSASWLDKCVLSTTNQLSVGATLDNL